MTDPALRFGTDGVRGRADTQLTEPVVRALGRAAGEHLGADRVVIGRDTRVSGPALERALAEGFLEAGVAVTRLGVVPTPAVAHLAALDGIAGAVVSASHNPWSDNGVKVFGPGGRKLDDTAQMAVERRWHRLPPLEPLGPRAPDEVVDTRWADAVVASVGTGALSGLRVVLDCAHGAMSSWAPEVVERLGAEVAVIHAEPDGRNINERCGSTQPEALQREVVDRGADAGLAFDGDGDRVVAVAADGTLLDGDHLLAVCAVDRHERGLLADGTVVVTVMANLGLRRALAGHGIAVHETAVGDRYVLEALHDGGWMLGGEQSGHLIFADLATTGDGLLTGVQALDAARRRDSSLGAWATELVVKAPQVLINVAVRRPGDDIIAGLETAMDAVHRTLGDDGRVLVRASGTEPLIRVMVEAADAVSAGEEAERLAAEVRRLDAAGD